MQFKTLVEFPKYEINPSGVIRHKNSGRIKGAHKNYKGYFRVVLFNEQGVRKHRRVHRLVAQTFIPNIDNKPEVNHKDGDKSNNHVDNLEWVTSEENLLHAEENKLTHKRRPVVQYDLEGNYVNQFKSITSASKLTGFSSSGIRDCCNMIYKQSKGYIWRWL